jgi:RND superfamily putative drug exporter
VKTGDTKSSIVQGIAQSARVITAAALIMVSVFGSFVLGDSVEIKMFGVGLASAVLIDATIIRLILVPATMTLLGDRNWWLPRWLDTALPHLDHSATGHDETRATTDSALKDSEDGDRGAGSSGGASIELSGPA